MAGFKTHISTSTVVGIAYGYWGVTSQSMSLENGMLAGGLCSVSGMLPDLDSDGGIPLREISLFAAAVVPILMLNRFRDYDLSHESMALAAMLIYVVIRFGAFEFFKRFTVHRGMWHSLPAAASAGLIAYLAMPCQSNAERAFKSVAVVVGFMVHLILDEIWAVEVGGVGLRTKKSFGTALKFFGTNPMANVVVYAMLFALTYTAYSDNEIAARLRTRDQSVSNPGGIDPPRSLWSGPQLPKPQWPKPQWQSPETPQQADAGNTLWK
ncbi:metal-dependent hydrolase [Stieleria sp. TO1_6]|uniref:metal-dependent hydrolase n=1 Tax=Stieleria tagensis TaxID=2956795 RepID=UPI00209B7426|nr:metal-dependent hydrolase [Stieleria tagensis]MCO8123820.1 metal-dependent hydrolase [Stieleria tagensis]